MKNASTRLLITSVLLSGSALPGCHAPLNGQNGLAGTGGDLPALRPDPGSDLTPITPLGEVVPLDRGYWSQERVVICREQVEHLPSYGSAEPLLPELGVPSRRWPSASSAIESETMAGAEALNALLAPLAAAANIVVFPVRAVEQPPWCVVRDDPEASNFELLPPPGAPPPWAWVGGPEPTGLEDGT